MKTRQPALKVVLLEAARADTLRLSSARRPVSLLWLLIVTTLLVGCGFDPDKRNPTALAGQPLLGREAIETVIELDLPPGNVTVSRDERVFFTFHPAARPSIRVAEVTTGGYEPYPDAEWQQTDAGHPHFVSPLSLRADGKGRLWVLDHGNYGESPSLTAFDIESRELVHRFEMPSEVAGWGSMVNDFWIDAEREVAYIADTSPFRFNPALIVYDIASGKARRLLEDHESVVAEDHHTVVQGRFLKAAGLPLKVAVDSIALSPDGETLVFGPMTGSRLFQVDAASLRDPRLTAEQLAARVTEVGAKPSTDGIAADSAGNIYLTAIEDDAIWFMNPASTLSLLARDAFLGGLDRLRRGEGVRWVVTP